MNIKQKFESIDQSQLSESQKEILSKIKLATKNFTIEDKKSIEKVDNALDNIISKLEKTKPQAIKKEVKEEKKEAPKKEEAPRKETSKKATKSKTKTPKNGGNGKRTMFSIAKEIRKADESWEEAKKRAKKIMEQEKDETTKKMKTETEKLLSFIKRKKELDGLSGTSVKKDSKIEALPKGRRISKNGKRYYEYRDNRTDRLAPNFADKIYLEDGGYAGGGYVVVAKSEKGGGFVMSKPTSKTKAEKLKSLLPKIDGESNEVMTIGKASKLSGLVGKEYLKYAEGGNVIDAFQMRTVRGVDTQPTEVLTNEQKVEFANGGTLIGVPETPLARGLDIDYTGLVGETGGMSAGEMFAEGGSLGNHGLKQGDQIIKTMSGGVQKVKTKSGDIVYVNLANGYRGAEPPLPFAKGGYTNERRHVNKSQDYEVRYAKNKPNRTGYLGKISFDEGGISNGRYEVVKVIGFDKNGKTLPKNEIKVIADFDSRKEALNFVYEQQFKKDVTQRDIFIRDTKTNKTFAEGGFMTDPNFGDFQSGVYATGGGVGKKKTQKELRNEYLEKLGSKEADVWDKIGAESGADIRNSDKMLKAYAEGVEEMLQKEGVGKGSFDQEDYDFYTDENWHLFNEFLVWNGYYEPEMTKTEKAWREDRFKDPKYRNYVSNPSIIKVSGSSKSKSNNYLPKRKISTITIVKDGKEIVLDSKDVLNGVNLYDAGGKLKNDHVYFAKRYVKEVITEDGDKFKPSNGYWVKKSALKSSNKLKSDFFEEDGLGVKYVKNGKFDKAKFKKDMEERLKGKRAESVIKIWARELGMNPSKYVDGEIIEDVDFVNDSTKKASDLFENKFEGGGKTTFKEKATAIAKKFEGKKVEPKYQKEYGKTYDKAEAKEVGNKIAGSQKAKYDAKMSKGGSTKRGGAMQLAKEIRKEGESWASALKRANEQIRNQK